MARSYRSGPPGPTPGFLASLTIASTPESYRKDVAASIVGSKPRRAKNYSGGDNSSRSSRSTPKSKSAGSTTYGPRGSKLDSSSRSTKSKSTGSSGGSHTSRRDRAHHEPSLWHGGDANGYGFGYGSRSGYDETISKERGVSPSQLMFEHLQSPSGKNNGVEACDREVDGDIDSMSRGQRAAWTADTGAKQPPPRGRTPVKHELPLPLDQSPHFKTVPVAAVHTPRQQQQQTLLSKLLGRLTLHQRKGAGATQHGTHQVPRRNTVACDSSLPSVQTRSQVSYAPERDAMYRGIPRVPGRRVEGEIVVHRCRGRSHDDDDDDNDGQGDDDDADSRHCEHHQYHEHERGRGDGCKRSRHHRHNHNERNHHHHHQYQHYQQQHHHHHRRRSHSPVTGDAEVLRGSVPHGNPVPGKRVWQVSDPAPSPSRPKEAQAVSAEKHKNDDDKATVMTTWFTRSQLGLGAENIDEKGIRGGDLRPEDSASCVDQTRRYERERRRVLREVLRNKDKRRR